MIIIISGQHGGANEKNMRIEQKRVEKKIVDYLVSQSSTPSSLDQKLWEVMDRWIEMIVKAVVLCGMLKTRINNNNHHHYYYYQRRSLSSANR